LGLAFNEAMNTAIDTKISLASTESMKSSVMRMLAVFCDASVCLSSELRMTGDTKKLSAMLMSARNLQDELLSNYIVDDDSQRFKDFIERGTRFSRQRTDEEAGSAGGEGIGESPGRIKSKEGLPPASSLHVKLRDGAGLRVPVEIFHVPIPNDTQHPGHLLGIREDSDRSSSSTVQTQHSQSITSANLPLLPREPMKDHVLSQSSGSSSSDSSSLSSEIRSSEIPLPEIASLMIKIDPMSELKKCFKVEINLDAQSQQLPCMKGFMPDTWQSFTEWVEASTNAFMHGSGSPDPPRVDIRLPTCPDAIISAKKASISFEAPDSEEDDEDNDCFFAWLELRDIVQCQRRSPQTRDVGAADQVLNPIQEVAEQGLRQRSRRMPDAAEEDSLSVIPEEVSQKEPDTGM